MSEQRKVLVIDDDESNRVILYELLARIGCDVRLCADGKTGLEEVTAAADEPFYLAFIDLHLPDVPGVEIIKAVRESSQQTFIVTATMDDDAQVVRKAYQAGSDMYLVKPYNVTHVMRLVNEAPRGKRWIVDQFGLREYLGIV